MRNRCIWLFLGLVFLALSFASGESLIEVDENGDEYELKRFYIQGRQLKGDGSQSQCVVTRRKRSGRALSAGSKAGETGASVQVSSQTLNVESLPAAMMEHREGAATLQEMDPSKRRYVALTGVHYAPHVPNDGDGEYEDDEEDEDDDEDLENEPKAGQSQAQFVPAALALPLAQDSSQGGGAGPQSSAAHLPQGVSVVANAASHANVAEDAGIVVVQSHQPPKVNPDTHAVFELKPIQADVQQPAVSFYPFVQPWEAVLPEDEDDYDEEDYDEEDYDDFYYGGYIRDQPGYVGLGEYDEGIVSEDSPQTTTALWSTDGDDGDIHPVINQANKRPNQTNHKNKNKNKDKNKNKNKNKNRNQKNKKRVSQKKRKEEAQQEEEHQLTTQKRKKEQKEKDQKKKQDKEQVQMDQSPVDVIKKPAAVASSSLQSSVSSSGSSSSASMSSVSNSSGSNSSDKKKKKKKKHSNSSSSSSTTQRRTKKKKKQGSSSSLSSGNRRRRPSSHLSSSSSSSGGFSGSSSGSSSSIGGYRRRRPQQSLQTQQQKRRRQQQQQRRRKQENNRRRQQQQKRRRNRNKNRQFYGDEPIINCIYINKDPPTTTTPRPFWNILGRQSDAKEGQAPGQDAAASAAVEPVDPVAKQAVIQAARRNFGDFGGRKRTNLRFVS